jgi:chorismate mutase
MTTAMTTSPTTVPVHLRTRARRTEQAINPTGTSDEQKSEEIPVPEDQAGIDKLRIEIDAVDAELVRLIQHRTAISHAIGLARRKIGGPRIVYSREMAILERFRVLGPAGTDLGMLLLAMGRGKLGRK